MRLLKIHHLACAALVLAMVGPAWGASEPEELVTLRTKFSNALDRATEALRVFWPAYQRSLTELKAKAQTEGNLEAMLAIDAELKKTEQQGVGKGAAYEPLKALETSYGEIHRDLLKQIQPEKTRLYGIYLAALQELETSLTKQSKLDEALLVRNASLSAKKEMGAAQKAPAVASAKADSSAPKASPGKIGTSKFIGHTEGGSEYRDVGKDRAVLVGFDMIITPFKESNDTVRGVTPVYQGQTKEEKGNTYGTERGSSSRRVVAKTGYAVGAIWVQWEGPAIRRMKVRFDRINGNQLDTKDNYESPWVGVFNGAKEEKVDLEGKLPVGIAGRSGKGLNCIGLVYQEP